MSFNTLLIQIVCLSCLLLVLQARRIPQGWVIVAIGILLILAGMYFLLPHWAGWVSGGLWVVFIGIPLFGYGSVNRLVSQERFRQARRLALWIRWLHPIDGMMEYPDLLHGLELGQQGKFDEAMQLFEHYRTTNSEIGRSARGLLYRMGARWQDAIAWIESLPEKVIFGDLSVSLLYLRALGETGDLNQLLLATDRFERSFRRWSDTPTLTLGRMFALAFCGQTDEVRQLFEGPLSGYATNIRQYWLATAELAAGDREFARQHLTAMGDRADPVLKNAISWRLSQPPVDLSSSLSEAARKILIRLRVETGQEANYSFRRVVKGRKAYATYLLIALNLVMFGLSVQVGGSEDPEVLYRLGALVPENAFAGEWWRLITANFLHLNLMHLLANMLGLFVLGRFVEVTLGVGKFLAIYAISGVGAMFVVAALSLATAAPVFVVGASGSIMGLLGAMAAIFLRGWQSDRAAIAGRQLLWLLALIGLQVVSDLLIPESSMLGHVSGVILGFVVGYMVTGGNREGRKGLGGRE